MEICVIIVFNIILIQLHILNQLQYISFFDRNDFLNLQMQRRCYFMILYSAIGVAGIPTRRGLDVHIVARQSPYPGTELSRFPILDKCVAWDVSNTAFI